MVACHLLQRQCAVLEVQDARLTALSLGHVRGHAAELLVRAVILALFQENHVGMVVLVPCQNYSTPTTDTPMLSALYLGRTFDDVKNDQKR